MIGLIKFLQKRPSDKAIRIWRILFWLIYVSTMYYNLIYQGDALESNYFWIEISETSLIYIKYVLVAFWFIPMFIWLSNICLLKKKYMRILQIFVWIFLFYISSKIVEWPTLDIDSLLILMWLFPFLAWITWKCITTKCLRYKEKITKVRV